MNKQLTTGKYLRKRRIACIYGERWVVPSNRDLPILLFLWHRDPDHVGTATIDFYADFAILLISASRLYRDRGGKSGELRVKSGECGVKSKAKPKSQTYESVERKAKSVKPKRKVQNALRLKLSRLVGIPLLSILTEAE